MLVIVFLCLFNSLKAATVVEFLRGRPDLSEFLLVLQRPGLHQAYLERQITIFVPTNKAMMDYRGNRGEELALNHLVNSLAIEHNLPSRLSSMVTGYPPIWVTRRSAWIFFNQARMVERSTRLQIGDGEEQIVYVIDSVLEPLLPLAIRNATFFQEVTAGKLLAWSTLYNLGDDGAARVFYDQAKLNKRDRMFDVPGRHTFFIPVDSAFRRSGREFGQQLLTRYPPGIGGTELKQVVEKDFVDAKVCEAHIVPGELLITSLIPTQEYATVAYDQQLPGVRVNVSLQPSLAAGGKVMVRSNTISGDNVHNKGMVVSRIIKGNIPVQNGIVHLIDKPLMVVARTLFDYLMEEGSQPGNRLFRFAQLVKDKGGLFGEVLLESKDGTLLAPSNEAMGLVDISRLNYILAHQELRQELFGLHFVRERISSNDPRIWREGEAMFSAPASWAHNRIWFQYEEQQQFLSVEGRGVNATVLEKDIGTVNGVIHVIDRVLGVPYQTIAEKMRSDPAMSHSWSLAVAMRLSSKMASENPDQKITIIVPTNNAWELVKRDFSTTFKSLTDVRTPEFGQRILLRHMIISDRSYTIEQLVERSLRSPTTAVPTESGELTFTAVGEIEYNAYKEWYVSWMKNRAKGKIVRPNIECKNGYIHLVDTVMLDDQPVWMVDAGHSLFANSSGLLMLLTLAVVAAAVLN